MNEKKKTVSKIKDENFMLSTILFLLRFLITISMLFDMSST